MNIQHTKSLLIMQRNLPSHWTEVHYCFAPNTLIREKGLPVLPVQISSSLCSLFSQVKTIPCTCNRCNYIKAKNVKWLLYCCVTTTTIICSKHKVGLEAYTVSRFLHWGYICICTTSLSRLLTTLHKGFPCRHGLISTLHI